MADEVTKETAEGTETGKYLTKKYLIANLQNFWKSIKQYITNQKFVNESYVAGTVNNAVDGKADKTELEALTTEVQGKANSSDLVILEHTVNGKVDESTLTNALTGKVDKVEGKGLSTNDFTADDKQKLDSINLETLVTEVDDALNETSTNPVQNWVINEALDSKVDKEADPIDPSGLLTSDSIQGYATSEGHIVLTFPQNTKYLKVYAPNSDRPIEKVSLWDGNSLLFKNFREENGNWAVTIENPKGTNEAIGFGDSFDFYIESLESIGNLKYKSFILQVEITNEMDLTDTKLTITKIF